MSDALRCLVAACVVDLAIGTYRRAVSTTIPEITRLAWEDKQEGIRKRTPDIDRSRFVFAFTRQEYEKAYGTTYKKPGILSRILFTLVKILPKVGPFRPLAFEPLTPEAVRLMEASFAAAREMTRVSIARCPAATTGLTSLQVKRTSSANGF